MRVRRWGVIESVASQSVSEKDRGEHRREIPRLPIGSAAEGDRASWER